MDNTIQNAQIIWKNEDGLIAGYQGSFTRFFRIAVKDGQAEPVYPAVDKDKPSHVDVEDSSQS